MFGERVFQTFNPSAIKFSSDTYKRCFQAALKRALELYELIVNTLLK